MILTPHSARYRAFVATLVGPLLSSLPTTSATAADTDVTWSGGTGTWSTASKWSPQLVPTNGSPAGATYAVRVDDNPAVTSRVTISFNSAYTVSSLRIDAGDEVRLNSDSSSLAAGRMTNSGTLTLGASSSSGSALLLDAPAFTLGGGGAVALNGGHITYAPATGAVALTIADQTVTGYGYISRASLVNQGTIRATPGTSSLQNQLKLDLAGSTVANDGLFEADGSLLYVVAGSVTNRGNILAHNGGNVTIQASAFDQGAVGQVVADGGVVTLRVPFMNPRVDAVTAQNGGTVTFDGAVTNSGQVLRSRDGGTMTFQQGALDNRGGTLRAEGTGKLNLNSPSVDNRSGRIELSGRATATAAPGLGGISPIINNDGGVVDLRDDAHFTLGGRSSLSGGTLASAGNASFEIQAQSSSSGPVLTSFTLSGTLNVNGYATIAGQVINQGTLNIRSQLSFSAANQVELSGGGTVNIAGTVVRGYPETGVYIINRDNTLVGAGGSIERLKNHALLRIDTGLTLGETFNDADGTIRVLPGATLTTTGPVTGTGTFEVQPGAALTAQGHIDVPAIHNAGSMLIPNSSGVTVGDLSGGGDIWIRYFGNLSVGSLDANQLKMEWPATLSLRPTAQAPTAPRAGRVRGIQFVGPGAEKIDLTDRALVVDYDPAEGSPLVTLGSKVAAAYRYQYGAWKDGPITSANAAADPANIAVGFAEASAVLGLSGNQTAMFLGQQVDASTVLIRTTVLGDADLNGSVNFADLLALARNYNSTAATWSTGDFDYNGAVNFSDLLILARHYNQAFDPAASAAFDPAFRADLAAAFASVPEPAALGAALLAPLLLPRRRRRRPI